MQVLWTTAEKIICMGFQNNNNKNQINKTEKNQMKKKRIENQQQMLCNNRPKGSLFVGIANAGNCNENKELETQTQ